MNIIRACITTVALCLPVAAIGESWHTPLVAQIDEATKHIEATDRVVALKRYDGAPAQSDLLSWVQYQMLIATAQAEANQYDGAHQLLNAIGPQLEATGDSITQIHALIDLGFIEHIRGSVQSNSCPQYKQAYDLSTSINDATTKIRAISKYAYCLAAAQQQPLLANTLLNDALAIAQENNLPQRRQALLLSSLAHTYSSSGLLNESLNASQQAIALWRAIGATPDVFNVAFSAAQTAVVLHQPHEAQPFINIINTIAANAPEGTDYQFFAAYTEGFYALNTSEPNLDNARSHFESALALEHLTQERGFVERTLGALIDIALRQNDPQRVSELLETHQQMGWSSESLGSRDPYYLAMLSLVEGDIATSWARIRDAEFAQQQRFYVNNYATVQHLQNQTLVDPTEYISQLRQRELEIERLNMAHQKRVAANAQIYMVLSIMLLLLTLTILIYFVYSRNQFRKLANTDNLTHIANRRQIIAQGEKAFNREFFDEGAAVVLIDIDHFKAVNDSFGHQTGDELLVAVAEILQDNLRTGDHVGRYGGEEFLVIFDRISHRDSLLRAEQIRAALERETLSRFDLRLTASIGVCHATHAMTLEEAISIADKALYSAKKNGRNQVAIDQPVDS